MFRTTTPVTSKVSWLVLFYAGICLFTAFFKLFTSELDLFSVENFKYVYLEDIAPYLPGFRIVLTMWIVMALAWRFGGEQKAHERMRYKTSLTDIERQLYEMQEAEAKLPKGPRRKKSWLAFLKKSSVR